MTIKELITQDELSWLLNKFSQLALNKIHGDH